MTSQSTVVSSSDITSKTTSLRHLVTSFLAALPTAQSDQQTAAATAAPLTDPLPALQDAASVLKAQTTKLGLLLVNAPLTPSAIHTVLTDLEARVLPSLLASGTDIITRQAVFGRSFASETGELLRAVLASMAPLLTTVDGVVLATLPALSKEQVLAVVGQVFSACDEIVALVGLGVVGLLLRKVKSQVQLIEDAIAELTEWGADVDLDATAEDVEDEDARSERGLHESGSLEDMTAGLSLRSEWNGQLPAYRHDLVELVPEATRRADLCVKLCLALSKRRIRKFTFEPPQTVNDDAASARQTKYLASCEQILVHATGMQDDMDEVAAAFYELDALTVKHRLQSLTQHAKVISQSVTFTWDGAEDEFTQWLQTWTRLLDKRASMIATIPTNET